MSGVQIFGYYLSPIELARIYGLVYFLGSILFAYILGLVLHELTHILTAQLLGANNVKGEIRFLGGGQVTYEMPPGKPVAFDRIINLAPGAIGIAVGLPALLYMWLATADILLLFILLSFWFPYTVLGGAADYSAAASKGDGHIWNPDKKETLAFIALGFCLMGVALASLHDEAGIIEHWATWTGRWLIAGGGAILGYSLWMDYQETPA